MREKKNPLSDAAYGILGILFIIVFVAPLAIALRMVEEQNKLWRDWKDFLRLTNKEDT